MLKGLTRMNFKEDAGQLIGDGFTGHHFRSWRL